MKFEDVVPVAADPGDAVLVGVAVGPGVPAIVTTHSTAERRGITPPSPTQKYGAVSQL